MKPIAKNVTTLVIQNLPGKFGQAEMLELWPIDGTYDYMHVPYNLLQKRSLGYVFINFLSNKLAAAFQRRWHGQVVPAGGGCGPRRPLDVAAAEVQGRRDNLQLIKSRKISQLGKVGFLPIVLENGVRLDAKAILAGNARACTNPPAVPGPVQLSRKVREDPVVHVGSSDSEETQTTVSGGEFWADDASQDDDFSPSYILLRL